MVGGFATAYDLVSSEYGWTDEQIGELALGRFRQTVAAIQLRRWRDQRDEASRVSWQTRTLAQYIAAGYMIQKGAPNTALDNAQFLGYDDVERAMVEAPGSSKTPRENKAGSFERLMGWAGDLGKRK